MRPSTAKAMEGAAGYSIVVVRWLRESVAPVRIWVPRQLTLTLARKRDRFKECESCN